MGCQGNVIIRMILVLSTFILLLYIGVTRMVSFICRRSITVLQCVKFKLYLINNIYEISHCDLSDFWNRKKDLILQK